MQRTPFPTLVSIVAFAGAVSLCHGAQLESVAVIRTAGAEQTSSDPAVPSVFVFTANATFDVPPVPGIMGELRAPAGDTELYWDGEDALYYAAALPTLSDLDDTFRAGNYRFAFQTGVTGTYTLRLTLTPLPVQPRVSNFDAIQHLERNQPFTLRWDAIPGATANDVILVSFEKYGYSYDSPELPGTAQDLTATLETGEYTGSITVLRSVQEVGLENNIQGLIFTAATTVFPLTVFADLPVFDEEPIDFRVAENGEAFFKASLVGNASPDGGVKWQRKPAGVPEWFDLTGDANTNYEYLDSRFSLRVKGIHPTFYGDEFRCAATATGRTVYSRVATIVRAPEYLVSQVALGIGGRGAARDFAGNIYVADYNSIRQVQPGGAVTLFAGTATFADIVDGTGTAASFSSIGDLTRGADGNLYVLDGTTLRRITPDGVVSTIAGQAGTSGLVDGQGSSARFTASGHLAADGHGNLYVADVVNLVIRKITPDGRVATIAGAPGPSDYVDGTGPAARFATMIDLAAAPDGTLFVTDNWNNVIRRVSPAGAVTTVVVEGGSFQWLISPSQISVDAVGNLLVVDGAHLRRIAPDGRVTMVKVRRGDGSTGTPDFVDYTSLFAEPDGGVLFLEGATARLRRLAPASPITFGPSPAPTSTAVSEAVVLTAPPVTAGGDAALAYQWYRNGIPLPGATATTYTIPNAQLYHHGNYTIVAAEGEVFGQSAVLALHVTPVSTTAATRLMNLSTRARAETGDRVLIPGFVISGSGSKRLLIRGVGPTLAPFGISDWLADPRISLLRAEGGMFTEVASNDTWGGQPNVAEIVSTSQQVGAFALPANSLDAALLVDLTPGIYTVLASDTGSDAGVAIVELYDTDDAASTARLVNISNRGFVGLGENIMIPGFVVSDQGPRTFLIRAAGPGLATFGVGGVLPDPRLDIYRQVPNENPQWILGNDNWQEDTDKDATLAAFALTGAFVLDDESKDAALLVTLVPGSYTVHATGVGGTTGIALVEIYEVP